MPVGARRQPAMGVGHHEDQVDGNAGDGEEGGGDQLGEAFCHQRGDQQEQDEHHVEEGNGDAELGQYLGVLI